MLYCPTLGEMKVKSIHSKTKLKVLGSLSLGIERSGCVESRLTEMVLRYFWVDTCCIDKSDAAELQTAINSMFQWYKNAAQCYVYLPDISISDVSVVRDGSDIDFESAFRASRWFTRGWTLQELLAPSSVEFFSADFKRFGDKKSLECLINEITGIPIEVFQGYDLAKFSVKKKVSWVSKRQTKYPEDMIYSLLGLVGVFLHLNYGEGQDNALRRLRDEVERCFPSGLFGDS
jgi:hypothetical protein